MGQQTVGSYFAGLLYFIIMLLLLLFGVQISIWQYRSHETACMHASELTCSTQQPSWQPNIHIS